MNAAALALAALFAQQNPAGLARPRTARVADRFTPTAPGEARLDGGFLGPRIERNARVRLLEVNEDDLLDTFERRAVKHQDWAGEHVGKFLHAASQAFAAADDAEVKAKLRAKIDRVAQRLVKTQEPDGYLGGYPPEKRWSSWDVWVHKYALLGLLAYHQYTGDAAALVACRRAGDLLIKTFGDGPGQRDLNKSGTHVGMAPDSVLEPIVLLYRATGDARYLTFAEYIVRHYDAPGGPAILASLEQHRNVRQVANAKAYEMLSNLNGLLELHRATGAKRLLDDAIVAWQDVVANRLYVTGSASSKEHFQDDHVLPNDTRANVGETCVTVSWEQMNLQLLRLTGESRFADEAERAIYNHLLAAQKPSGDKWAYYTSLEGKKPYGNKTNCCLSSGPRGVALIPAMAYMTSADGGLVVNLYNGGRATARLRGGKVTVEQTTDYPFAGKVRLTVTPEKNGQSFPLRLRVPGWSPRATVAVAGQAPSPATPGGYATVTRKWRKGDTVELDLEVPVRILRGDHGNDGKAAVLLGPVVLAADTALNGDATDFAHVELAEDPKLAPAPDKARDGEPVFRADGRIEGKAAPVYLTPFAFAGQDGASQYAVWLPMPGAR